MVNTLHPPASVIASWPRPNYIDPSTRGPALEYVCIIFSALAIFIVTARLYSRLLITRAPGLDDLLAVFALLFSIALSVLVIIGNKLYYSGRHVWDIPTNTFVPHRINIWASMWCYIVAATLVKISVLLFYRRLSVKFSKLFLVATWVGIIYNVLYLVGFGLALLLLCHPVFAYWNQFDVAWVASHGYRCGSENVMLPASAGFSVLGDFYSTLLPLLLIINLDLPLRQKIALFSLFALGFLAVAAGVVRTVLMYNLLNTDYDFSWVLWETWIWAVVELYVALFAASAPALKPFFRRFFIDPLGSMGRSSRRHWLSQGGAREADPKGTWASVNSKEGGLVDVERIGMAYGRNEPGSRESGFLRDIEQDETRHFELRASRDGKMIPMQVYKGSMSSSEMPSILLSDEGRVDPGATRPINDWPMSPSPTHPGVRGQSGLTNVSQPMQHPLHVGLRVQTPTNIADPLQGTIRAADLRAQSRVDHSRGLSDGLDPFSADERHAGLASGSRLESPSDSDAGSLYIDEKPPWNTIKTSSSLQTREASDSDETLHLPRMGNHDSYTLPEKRTGIGYAI
ncbi:hypothetical protein A1O1_08316 [Capronia coronata CBS 617.96]|uniref:Rhodopsin domain-containing protein n=1 Tax=Capronia coronata CBS 617.96 TaxID=1182541 RepID=W9YCW2_9EURO|nr:uncharacterized protein A1O1_08316 [Capronia coronata CBS 617.96]EXJ80174.1 hypothetical protein A1O1_08316 [Capronia coronata CBS 617.96]